MTEPSFDDRDDQPMASGGLPGSDPVASFDGFARELASASGAGARLSIGIGVAAEMIQGCDHVGVTQATRTGFTTTASSDRVARQGDQWQYDLSEGPCVSSVREHETVLSLDLRREIRWPRWSPRMVEELGVGSILSLLLYTNEHSYGAINLYGDRLNAFDSADLAVAHSVAAHLAVAMAASNEIAHLGVAVTSRTVIGQAEGMLMERLHIDADQAFSYLRRISQDTNRKLVDVAAELVDTRRLPQSPEEPPTPPRPGPPFVPGIPGPGRGRAR